MRSRWLPCLSGAVLLAGIFALTARSVELDQDAILGRWYTAENKALVEIYACDGRYCGRIVWLKEPRNADGTDKVDANHPDPRRHHTPIIGLQLVWDFSFDGDRLWAGGKIYDPQNGKTYSCKMRLTDDERLKVRGYIGVSLLGRTQIWKRAAQP